MAKTQVELISVEGISASEDFRITVKVNSRIETFTDPIKTDVYTVIRERYPRLKSYVTHFEEYDESPFVCYDHDHYTRKLERLARRDGVKTPKDLKNLQDFIKFCAGIPQDTF